jgi:hypothetical protein
MVRTKRPVGNIVAKMKAALFVAKKQMLRSPKLRSNPALIWRKSLQVTALAALSLNIIATGLPALIARYNESQARIPHYRQPLRRRPSQMFNKSS